MRQHLRLLVWRPAARVPLAVALALAGTIALAAVSTPSVAPATTLEGVRATHVGQRTTVILTADGQLTPANVMEGEKPRRLVLAPLRRERRQVLPRAAARRACWRRLPGSCGRSLQR